MATLHEIVITRPTLDALHPLESNSTAITPLGSLDEPAFKEILLESGILSIGYAEAISWTEVFSRLSELRSDLRTELEEIGQAEITGNPSMYGSGPFWNPFSLTWTMTHEYIDKESAIASINEIWTNELVALLKSQCSSVNSTWAEKLIVDGIEDTTYSKKW